MRDYTRTKLSRKDKVNPFLEEHKLAYNSWRKMRQRCNDKNYSGYKNYGGRGISICQEWNVFNNFLKDMGDPPILFGQRLSLERINNDEGYCKENCKWATYTEQIQNQRPRLGRT